MWWTHHLRKIHRLPVTYEDKLLLPMFNQPHQRSSKCQPLYLVMNSYWSLDSRDSVLSAGYSPINKPKFTMPSDESKHTAIQETKPGAPCCPLLNCTWCLQGLSNAPIPRVSKHRTFLCWISTVANTKAEPTISFLASHSYACYHLNKKHLRSDKTQPRTHLTGKKKPPIVPNTHVALFFSIPVGSGPQAATHSIGGVNVLSGQGSPTRANTCLLLRLVAGCANPVTCHTSRS